MAPATAPDSGIPTTTVAARRRLLGARLSDGSWEGHLSSSALSTATAVVAIALFHRDRHDRPSDAALVGHGIAWLLAHQNEDGGWGDTDRSFSNISTTALVWAALAFAEPDIDVEDAVARADAWLATAAGGRDPATLARAIVARYGKDRTFSVPILTMCTLAGRMGDDTAAWRLIPQLPFELSVIPRRLFTIISLPVVSYALPALIAMGLVHHVRGRSWNLLARLVRRAATARALRVLASLQPPNGGFLEAAPLTSFVTMSLVAAGHADGPVARRGIDFLRQSVRPDGSWPIDTNLATWLTTLSIQALSAGGAASDHLSPPERGALRRWLLAQQTQTEHLYTGAAPGAWAWTPLPGGVPDADDTAGALLALHHLGADDESRRAAADGARWLLDLQNRDGGIPTFCRGWGALPFDRSGADLTAHAIRAWLVWRDDLDPALQRRIDAGVDATLRYLASVQRPDGAFVPLWFGNQHAPNDENPTYGTSRVLPALVVAADRGLSRAQPLAARAVTWLLNSQNPDGGWGGDRGTPSSIEETALAVSALGPWAASQPDDGAAAAASPAAAGTAASRGAAYLTGTTGNGQTWPETPIGFYFAKLWYYERLYPLILTTDALGRLRARP